MWRFEQKGLFTREKVPKVGICKPGAKVRARKPNSLAFTRGERELGKSPGQIPGGPAAKVRARKPNSLAFTRGEREPGKSPGQIPGGPAAKVRARKPNSLAFRGGVRKPGGPCGRVREKPAGPSAGPSKNKKTLNQRTFRSADSKFFHYILHPIYKEGTYSFSPRAKRRMVRPTPSSSLLSAT